MIRALILAAAFAAAACTPPAQQQTSTDVEITAPESGAAVSSPLRVEGVAPQDWYFEAIFTAELHDASGAVIAEAPAQAQTDWTEPGPVPFLVEFTYSSATEQNGTIVLIADRTGEPEPPLREVRIPVVLSATP